MNALSELWELFSVFFRIGSVTFGGGYAMIPILERELAEKRGWTTTERLSDYYAISQATPGIIAVNVATFIGYNRRGITGAVIATAGVVAPSVIIITIIAHWISNFNEIPWVQKALAGINIAVAALLTQASIQFCKKSVRDGIGAALLIISFATIFILNLNPIFIIIFAAAVGIALAPWRARREEERLRQEAKELHKEKEE